MAASLLRKKIYGINVADYFLDATLLDTRHLSADKIITFNQIHFTLFSVCNLIRSYFSVRLLLIFLRVGVELINTGLVLSDFSGNYFSRSLSFIVVSSSGVIWMYLVADMCYRIKCESKRTSRLVTDLLDEEHPECVEEELQAFHKQLLVRKIEFSASGFFEVDLEMMTSMIGIVIPAALFLVQYNNGQHKHGTKP
uniref:Gustatory receptor 28b n=1 Tax=Subpsaltria yangi TaxID=1195109 RepID=A0A385IUV5_9HEMI|nr:gustatory receptor 28b [Subpsaltria yangi]